ncbi:MAG: hypothetical protein M1819_005295 [Sarea resinae]|nr:MAG: hypothetical protein M1819_005295 [Sarea resinae]
MSSTTTAHEKGGGDGDRRPSVEMKDSVARPDERTKHSSPSSSTTHPTDLSEKASDDELKRSEDVEDAGSRGPEDEEDARSADGPATTKSGRPPISLLREVFLVAIITMAQLMTQAALGNTVAPTHIISKSFDTKSAGELSWYMAGYSLTVGTFIFIAGRLGDMYGHKLMFVGGFSWFALWSMIAGLSVYTHNQIFFDVCRAFQGIGPAFVLPNGIAVLGRLYPQGTRKNMVFSIFGASAPGGFVIGAAFGSIFAQLTWWPWAFWCLTLVCALIAGLAVIVIPTAEKPPADHPVQKFDFIGSVLGVGGMVLINVAWNQGPIVGWQTPYTYILLIIGILLLVAFSFAERRVAQPLLPMEALNSHSLFVLACVAAGWSSFGIWLYYTWQFLELIRGSSPLLATAQFGPAPPSGLAAALTSGYIMHRVKTSWVMLGALTAFMVGDILMATAPAGQTYWVQTFVALLIIPWGMDMSFPASTLVLSNTMPHQHQGMAASLVTTIINYSMSIGLGIAGTVEMQINKSGTEMLKGYRAAWYTAIGLSGLGVAIAALFVYQSYTKHGNVQHT